MSDNCRPIGFFDSGVGGISVLKTAYKLMPEENYIYYGDNANAPYGEKSEDEIKSLSLAAGRFLFDRGVKAIVIACNTATSASVKLMREEFNIPVISMEPAVRPALSRLKGGKILVLATSATVTQQRYLSLLDRLGAKDKTINVGCSGLVEMVESSQTSEREIHAYLASHLPDQTDVKIDAVVIGCTHYSFVSNEIKSYIDKAYFTDCSVFDGKDGTAAQLRRILDENGLRCSDCRGGAIQFFTSGGDAQLIRFHELFDNYMP
jgi:glutamate racemase